MKTKKNHEIQEAVRSIKSGIEEIYNSDLAATAQNSIEELVISSELTCGEDIKTWFILSEGITMERYAEEVRLNKVKEHLVYSDLSTEEIALKLGYSSAEDMSAELLQLTGLPLSFFLNLREQRKKSGKYLAREMAH